MEKSKWFNEDNLITSLAAKSKEEAISKLGYLLYQNGYVKESFIPAVIAREHEFPTGLPTKEIGVAIPHTDICHVKQQAIAVGILKEPVKFCTMGDPNETEVDVSLILMLAVSDKNKVMTMITNVIEIIQNPNFLKNIYQTGDRSCIVQMLENQLNFEEKEDDEKREKTGKILLCEDNFLQINQIVNHPVGLHARPASLFVKAAQKYQSEILVLYNDQQANAKSILSILSLGVNHGSEISIKAKGGDAEMALNELQKLIQSNFGGVA